jgi:hypothetical protein
VQCSVASQTHSDTDQEGGAGHAEPRQGTRLRRDEQVHRVSSLELRDGPDVVECKLDARRTSLLFQTLWPILGSLRSMGSDHVPYPRCIEDRHVGPTPARGGPTIGHSGPSP